jgi:hypothetical protein
VLGAPERVALADLDGDGAPEVVGADGAHLVAAHLDGSGAKTAPALGAPQHVVAGPCGDTLAIVVGWGMDRAHRQARARLSAYLYRAGTDTLAAETILEPDTSRQDVAALRLCRWPGQGPGVLYAVFDSKYFVRLGFATRRAGAWTTRELGRFRMASAIDLVHLPSGPQLVVGRLYGDSLSADGEAFLLTEGGARTPLPTTRGVRALVAGTDGIFLGDGWHREYAAKARGLVTRVALPSLTPALVEDTPGQYMVWKLELADLDGDGVPELLGLGSKYLRAWKRVGRRFLGTTLDGEVRDFAAAAGRVLLGGAHPELLRFGNR